MKCPFGGTHAISCLSCEKGNEHLTDCQKVVQCPEGQACFVERVMDLEIGNQKYLAGCRDMSLCNIEGCSAKETMNITDNNKRSDIPVCTECCFHSLCNTQGCGGVFAGNSTSIQCFGCPEVYGNMSCNTFTLCDNRTHMCQSEVIDATKNHGHPNAVALGCGARNKCGFLKQLYINQSTPLEDQSVHCCDSHLCNWKPLDDTGVVESIANKLTCPPNLVERTTNSEGITKITNTPRTTTETPPTTPTMSSTTTTTTTSTTTTLAPTTTSTSTTPKTTTTPVTARTSTSTTQKKTTTITTTSTLPETTSVMPVTTTQSITSTPAPTTTITTTTPAPTTTITTTTPAPTTQTTEKPTTAAPATQTTEAPPFQLGTESTKCHQCTGPIQICEQIHFSKPCLYPNNYCINHITNHLDGTKTVNRTCGNFDTCYREWYLGTSDEDKCDVIKNNQHVDFQCTFCCIKNDCNVPLRPAEDSLYKPRMIG